MNDPAWPFDQPRNAACLTLWNILRAGAPILLVTHDDDGSWQFLDGRDAAERDAAIVGLGEMTGHDPSLFELADLPEGWRAWRSAPGEAWKREKRPAD